MLEILEFKNYKGYRNKNMIEAKVRDLESKEIFIAHMSQEELDLQLMYNTLLIKGLSSIEIKGIEKIILDFGLSKYDEGFDNGYDSGCGGED